MNMEFIEAIHELEKERGISAEILFEAIEAALISAYKKNFSSLHNVKVNIDRNTGKINVYACKNIVEKVEDPRQEISLEEARSINPNYSVEDLAEFEVTPSEFGRIAAQTAKQVVVQRIREAERSLIYDEYVNREGDIVTGLVQRYEQRNLIVDLGKTEAILLASEQIPGEMYQPFERIKAFVVEVKKTTKGPQIILSRTHPGLVRRLFELEVPEVHDGLVEIKAIAREAGARSKIAVYSRDKNVDPVGACVGQKGNRVQVIVNELRGEKMDIIMWSADPIEFVSNALSPAKAYGVYPKAEDRTALVVVSDYQLSLAIGKEGQNARLAAKITGWKIDIKSETQARNLNLIPDEFGLADYDSEYDSEDSYQDGYFSEEYNEGEYDEEYAEEYDGEYDEEYTEEYNEEYAEGYGGEYNEEYIEPVEGVLTEGDPTEGVLTEGVLAEGDLTDHSAEDNPKASSQGAGRPSRKGRGSKK